MNRNTYSFKLVALLTLMLIPAALVQAKRTKRNSKFPLASDQLAFSVKRDVFDVERNILKAKSAIRPSLASQFTNQTGQQVVRGDRKNSIVPGSLAPFSHLNVPNIPNNRKQQKCDPTRSLALGVGVLNLGVTNWKDNYYLSASLGLSTPKLSASMAQGKCEPLTGFFVNASAAQWGRGASLTWYPGKGLSAEKIYSTPTFGASAGWTYKF